MKKYIVMGALAALAVSPLGLMADTMPARKDTTVLRKPVVAAGPVDRTLEVRLGPRVSFLDGDVRVGRTGTEFSIWDGLNFDEPNIGADFDVDWQPWNRIHVIGGLTYDKYDQDGTTALAISRTGGDRLAAGSTVSADIDLFTFVAKLGYDVIKNNTWRVMPYIGGKGAYVDGRATATGTVLNAAGASLGTRTLTIDDEVGYGTFFGGVDTRAYISRDWYVGGDIGAFGLDNWTYLTGDAYTGYDFNQTWGVRLGYDFNYVDYENSNNTVKADPLLGAVYVQAVWGY